MTPHAVAGSRPAGLRVAPGHPLRLPTLPGAPGVAPAHTCNPHQMLSVTVRTGLRAQRQDTTQDTEH